MTTVGPRPPRVAAALAAAGAAGAVQHAILVFTAAGRPRGGAAARLPARIRDTRFGSRGAEVADSADTTCATCERCAHAIRRAPLVDVAASLVAARRGAGGGVVDVSPLKFCDLLKTRTTPAAEIVRERGVRLTAAVLCGSDSTKGKCCTYYGHVDVQSSHQIK